MNALWLSMGLRSAVLREPTKPTPRSAGILYRRFTLRCGAVSKDLTGVVHFEPGYIALPTTRQSHG